MERTRACVLAVLVTALSLGACECGGTPYKQIARAQRGLDHVARFGEIFDRAIKAWVVAEDKRCSAKHAAKSPEYAACMKKALKTSWAWTGEKLGTKTGKGLLPNLQRAQLAARHAINAAHDYVLANEKACAKKEGAPAKCKAVWMPVIKPSLCAAWQVAEIAVSAGAYDKTSDPAFVFVRALAASQCGGAP
jgi:hypothetical protein